MLTLRPPCPCTRPFAGDVKNYLTYSVLGGLVAKGKVAWDKRTKLYAES